jgi:transposase
VEQEYIGIDLHKAFFQVCAINSRGERQWEQQWPTTDVGIAAMLGRCGPQTRIAVEASSPTWAFVDRVVSHVGAVHVVDTRKTRIKAGYAAKTDRLDARRLADALRRESVVGIYYPPPAIRELRELCRYRCHLARMQASLKQRIHALLLRQGVTPPRIADLFGRRGTQWLDTVALEGWPGVSLTGLRRVLADIHGQLTPVLATIEATAAADPIARASAPCSASRSGPRSARSRVFPTGRTWRVMLGWFHASHAAPAAVGRAGSPKPGRRGCGGP